MAEAAARWPNERTVLHDRGTRPRAPRGLRVPRSRRGGAGRARARGVRRDRQDHALAGRRRGGRGIAATASCRVEARSRRPGCPMPRSAISSVTAPDALLAGMPTPLRRALDAALLRADAPGGSLDQRAVSLAAAHALRTSRPRRPWSSRSTTPVDRRAVGPRPVVRPAARRRRADRRARVGQARIRLRGRSASDLDRAMTRTTHLARRPAADRAARADPSRANEPADSPTPTWPGSTASPAATRCSQSRWLGPLPAMASAWTPDGVWAVPEDLQQLLSARLAAVPAAAHEPAARHRRDVPADLGAGARDRRIERANARTRWRRAEERRHHRAGERPGAVHATRCWPRPST